MSLENSDYWYPDWVKSLKPGSIMIDGLDDMYRIISIDENWTHFDSIHGSERMETMYLFKEFRPYSRQMKIKKFLNNE